MTTSNVVGIDSHSYYQHLCVWKKYLHLQICLWLTNDHPLLAQRLTCSRAPSRWSEKERSRSNPRTLLLQRRATRRSSNGTSRWESARTPRNKIGKILSIKRHLPGLKNFFAATEASKYARDTCMSKKVLGTISSLQTFNNVECSNTIVNLMVVEGQQRCCDSGAVRYD